MRSLVRSVAFVPGTVVSRRSGTCQQSIKICRYWWRYAIVADSFYEYVTVTAIEFWSVRPGAGPEISDGGLRACSSIQLRKSLRLFQKESWVPNENLATGSSHFR